MVHPITWAREQHSYASGRPIPMPARHLLLLLASHADATTGVCWLLYSTLADELGCSRRTAMRLMADLEANGLVQVEARYRRSNIFRVMAPLGETRSASDREGSVKELARGLTGKGSVLDGFLIDFSDDPASAYHAALAAAVELGAEYPDLSNDPTAYLVNEVIARCAFDTHGLKGRPLPRLFKEAKVLGKEGPAAVIAALCRTSSAHIEGDPTSYVIATARRIAAEAKAVSA